MSIEIYNKAKIIKKDNIFYFFLKYHSKNDCICGGQIIVDDNFNDKYIARDSRAGSWSIKAHGFEGTVHNHVIANTYLNCPTSYIYGEIRFGNKKNIALYYAKNAHKYVKYETLTEMQKKNIDGYIEYYNRKPIESQCNLDNIPETKKFKAVHTYCGNQAITLENNSIKYADRIYWNLDNL